jgi:hypothetical protein
LKRVWLRAGALVLAAIGVLVGLTIYFSAEDVPPCLASGTKTWRAPTDNGTHRYEVVFLDEAACFFDMDDGHKLVGQLKIPGAKGISTAARLEDDIAVRAASGVYTIDLRNATVLRGGLAPFWSPILTLPDEQRHVMYVTRQGSLGFRVLSVPAAVWLYDVHFKGFTWNRKFGPNPPSHGLSLAPDRPELWVLDAPNNAVHVFDVSALPKGPPRPTADIRLTATMDGTGSLQHSADGRWVYVGDAGDVIDTRAGRSVLNLEALRKSRVQLEVDWVNGRPVFPG